MKKTINQYLAEISCLYKELEKDVYGRRMGGGRDLPPNANSFFNYTKKIYAVVWKLISENPQSIYCNEENKVHDFERVIMHELDVLRNRKKYGDDDLMGILEDYYQKIGDNLNLFLFKMSNSQ